MRQSLIYASASNLLVQYWHCMGEDQTVIPYAVIDYKKFATKYLIYDCVF